MAKVKRKTVTKKLRFEVFKRDSFCCVYCGKTPPEVNLEVDHIDPVSKGGGGDINNLVTSCFDCNRGKGAIPLSVIPSAVSDNVELLKEKELQIKEYRKFITQIKRRETRDQNKVAKIFSKHYEKKQVLDSFKKNSIGMFLRKIPLHEVEDAMEIACSFISDNPEEAIRYFCGICWRKIKNEQ